MVFAEAITVVDMVATAVFAVSGDLAAAETKSDILGYILFGTITGIGGGTLRACAIVFDLRLPKYGGADG